MSCRPQLWTAYGLCILAVLNLAICLPIKVVDLKDKNLDFTLQNLEKQIAVSNTPSRITKLHHLNNGTQDTNELSRRIFSQLMESLGWSKVEIVVPMYWTKIVTIRSPFHSDKERALKCKEIFHPDHFMSNIILENLVKTKINANDKLRNSISEVFCNKNTKQASLHFVQSDDVISGIVILSTQNDGSVLSLANVGF